MSLPDYAAAWQINLVRTANDVTAFGEWVDTFHSHTALAIDTETVGLDWTERDFTRLVQFADGEQAWAVPVRWWGRPLFHALERIRDADVRVYFWNANFDMHALADDGWPAPRWENVVDGRIVHHLLFPHYPHSLKPTSAEILGEWALAGQNQLKADMAAHNWDWADIPVDHPAYWQYGCLDTLLTYRLCHHHLMPALRDPANTALRMAFEREMHVADIAHRAERRGMRVDFGYAEQTRRLWSAEAVTLADDLAAAGLTNPNSNRQIENLFRDLGWEPEDYTDTGQAVLDKAVLAALSETYPDLAPKIVRYKRLTKWISTYLEPFACSGGRVHPEINTLRARTGRMSITNPPLQTLPSKGSGGEIRRCVLPERGHALWACDYDGQEARLFANYSGDPGMAAAYNAGDDLYTHVARVVYDDESITKDDPRRTTSKVVLLAFTYGAGPDKLALASGLPRSDVERFLLRLFQMFPTVRDMTGDHAIGGTHPGGPALSARQRYNDEGLAYVITSGGRRFSMPEGEEYKAVNGIMQGSGADVLKAALVRLDRAGLADNMIVPVHDEVVFSFPTGDEGADAARQAASLMEDHEWEIPLTTELSGPHPHWGAAYGFTGEDPT